MDARKKQRVSPASTTRGRGAAVSSGEGAQPRAHEPGVVAHLSVDPNTLDAALSAMPDMDGPTLVMTLDRNKPNEPDNVTFSRDAVDAVGLQMKGWLLSRIYRQFQQTGKMPKHLNIVLTVSESEVG